MQHQPKRERGKFNLNALHFRRKVVYCILWGGYYVIATMGIISFRFNSARQMKQRQPPQHLQRRQQQHQQQHRRHASLPFHYHQHRCDRLAPSVYARVRASTLQHWYCVTLLLLATVAVPFATRALNTHMHILHSTALMLLVGRNRFILMQVAAVATLGWQCLRKHSIVSLLNRMLRQQRLLYVFTRRRTHVSAATAQRMQHANRRGVVLICFKLLALLASPAFVIFVIVHEKAGRRPDYMATLLYFYYCQLVLQLTLSMYFVAALLVAHHVQQLNALLRHVLNEAAQRLRGPRPLGLLRRQQLHSLIVAIGQLQRSYARCLRFSRQLMQLYGPQLLVFLTFVGVECTVQCFTLYYVSCSHHKHLDPIDPGKPTVEPPELPTHCQLRFNPWAMIYVVSLFCDMCLVVHATDGLQARLRVTRVVLDEGSARLPWPRAMCRQCIDAQLDNALAQFALYLRLAHEQQLQQRAEQGRGGVSGAQSSFMACGLFALDRRLLFVIFQTILSYLLILIQYDKILNH